MPWTARSLLPLWFRSLLRRNASQFPASRLAVESGSRLHAVQADPATSDHFYKGERTTCDRFPCTRREEMYLQPMSVLTQRIVSEIESAPEPIQAEVLDFVLFVKARAGSTSESDSATRIRSTPRVSGGEACIGMTRIAVWMLEDARRTGVGELDLLKDYPGLSVNDLEAAWQYVDMHHEEIDQAILKNREA